MSQLFVSKKERNSTPTIEVRGLHYDNTDNCFTDIEYMRPITVHAAMGNKMLITLTVPDTWCDKAGDGGWFGIKVDDTIVARGWYSIGMDLQHVPITLQAVVEASTKHEFVIKAVWGNCGITENRACYIGSYSETTLTVLLLD